MDLGRGGGICRFGKAHKKVRHDDILQTVKIAPPLTIPLEALEERLALLSQAADEAVAALPAAEIRERASSTETMAKYSARLAATTGKG